MTTRAGTAARASPVDPQGSRAPQGGCNRGSKPLSGSSLSRAALVLAAAMVYIGGLMSIAAIPQHPVETTDTTFAALGLSAPILANVERVGFVHPTPIQAAIIPAALT